MKRNLLYCIYIGTLFGYALLSPTMLYVVYTAIKVLSALIVTDFIPSLRKEYLDHIKAYLDILRVFQKPVRYSIEYIKSNTGEENFEYLLLFVILLFPTQHLFLTQWLAIYVLSLFCYQFVVMSLKRPGFLGENLDSLDVAEDFKSLSALDKAQMKLVTMLSLSIATFLPMNYCQVVCLFAFVSIAYPLMGKRISEGVNLLFNYFASNGIDRKPLEALVGTVFFFSLLLNYKYDHFILSFLYIVYCSFIIGQTASHFYQGIKNDKINSSDEIIELVYNDKLILPFWAVILLYEIASKVTPTIAFIAVGSYLGADPELEKAQAMFYKTTSPPDEGVSVNVEYIA